MNTLFISDCLRQSQIAVPFQPCNCRIALVSITFPNLSPRNRHVYDLTIVCDQIDSNMLNRKRILRKIRCKPKEDFYVFDFSKPVYFPLDSNKRHLSFQFYINDEKITTTSKEIFMYLNIKPQGGAVNSWVRHI